MAKALPLSWRWTTLANVAAPVPNAIVDGPFGSNLKLDDYVEDGVPVLQGKNITDDRFRWFDVRFISNRKATELERSSVRVGDILIVKIGSIGYSAILDDLQGFDYAIIPANLAKVTPDLDVVDRSYLHKWLTSVDVKRYFLRVASKTAQPALSLGKIRGLPVPLPPLPEQRRIAAILDKADAVRRKRQQTLNLADQFLRSAFLDMFGDPVTNPKGWDVVRLLEVSTRVTDGTHQPPAWAESGIPFLFISNIVAGRISFDTRKFISQETWEQLTRRCPIEINDILYTTVGSYGNAAIVDTGRQFAFQRHIAHIKPDARRVHPEYLLGLLQSPSVRAQAAEAVRGIAQKTLNLEDLKRFRLHLPPMPEQERYVRLRRQSLSHGAAAATAGGETQALFSALIQRAFRGNLATSSGAIL